MVNMAIPLDASAWKAWDICHFPASEQAAKCSPILPQQPRDWTSVAFSNTADTAGDESCGEIVPYLLETLFHIHESKHSFVSVDQDDSWLH